MIAGGDARGGDAQAVFLQARANRREDAWVTAEPEIIAAAEVRKFLAAPENISTIYLLQPRPECDLGPQSSSSSLPLWAKTNAARRGGGIGLSGPRIERQMISLRSRSSAASSFAKVILPESAEPHAVFLLRSVRSTFAARAL